MKTTLGIYMCQPNNIRNISVSTVQNLEMFLPKMDHSVSFFWWFSISDSSFIRSVDCHRILESLNYWPLLNVDMAYSNYNKEIKLLTAFHQNNRIIVSCN